MIREAFATEISKAKTANEKVALADLMISRGLQMQNSPADQFAVLKFATGLAVEAGAVDVAFDAIAQIDSCFDIDAFAVKASVLSQIEFWSSADVNQPTARKALDVLQAAVKARRWDHSARLADLASRRADKSGDERLAKGAGRRKKEAESLLRLLDQVEQGRTALKSASDDPAANLSVGVWYGFTEAEWDRGLTHLAKSRSPHVSEVAALELSHPTTPEGQLALADKWWGMTADEVGVSNVLCKARGALWYRMAMAQLTGLARLKAEKRLQEISLEIPDATHPPTLIDQIAGSASSLEPPQLLVAPFSREEANRTQRSWSIFLGVPARVTNSLGMNMVLIPLGEFVMGSPESEEERESCETQHPVRISQPFYIGTTEVTRKQYQAILGPGDGEESGSDGGGYPTASVSWLDATVFCQSISAHERRLYRLPAEAEWEYACRSGTTTPYSYGDVLLPEFSNYEGGEGYLARAGRYEPNPFGVHDSRRTVTVHHDLIPDEKELGKKYNTLPKLLSHPQVRKYVRWRQKRNRPVSPERERSEERQT